MAWRWHAGRVFWARLLSVGMGRHGCSRAVPAPTPPSNPHPGPQLCPGPGPQLTALDLHFIGNCSPFPTTPSGWAALAASPTAPHLHRLHAATSLGWGPEAFSSLCAAATGLRDLALTDNAGAVGDDSWLAGLASCRQLSRLDMGSCRGLTPVALDMLRGLTTLTSIVAYRCVA